jgi:hypothetical protein
MVHILQNQNIASEMFNTRAHNISPMCSIIMIHDSMVQNTKNTHTHAYTQTHTHTRRHMHTHSHRTQHMHCIATWETHPGNQPTTCNEIRGENVQRRCTRMNTRKQKYNTHVNATDDQNDERSSECETREREGGQLPIRVT